MSEIIETVKNIAKDGDVCTYDQVLERPIRTTIEELNKQKQTLETKIATIDYIISEIGKLG